MSTSKIPPSSDPDRAPVLIALVPACAGTKEFIEHLKENVKTLSSAHYYSLYNTVDVSSVTKMWLDLDNSEKLSSELTKYITFDYFELGLRKVISNGAHAEVVINAAKELVNFSSPFKFTDTVDILMNENVDGSQKEVRKTAKALFHSHNGLICCSCMTADQDFLKSLLKYSWAAKRVVRFIRWDYEVSRMTFEDIIQRNVAQLFRSGRYYSLSELSLSYRSWSDLYSNATIKYKRLSHSDLAAFLGSFMDNNGFVQPLNEVKKVANGESSSSIRNRWTTWSNSSTLTCLPPAVDEQASGNAEEILAARITFLETRLLLSEEEVVREQKAAESQLTAAKRKEEELKALQNSSSQIHKSRATMGDFGQLQAQLVALKEQKNALQTSITQAETLSQLVLHQENEIAVHRGDVARLAVAVTELEEQNAVKISELIELKLSVCDLADKLERKKKIFRSLTTNSASTRKPKQGNTFSSTSSRGNSNKMSKLSSKERMSIESPSMDGSRTSKLSNHSSGSGNSDQNPLSLMHNLSLSHLGQESQGSLSSIRRVDNGRHISVRFERSPTIASVESLEY